eukprot:1181125-Prorocentrum_minimum.AAC.1
MSRDFASRRASLGDIAEIGLAHCASCVQVSKGASRSKRVHNNCPTSAACGCFEPLEVLNVVLSNVVQGSGMCDGKYQYEESGPDDGEHAARTPQRFEDAGNALRVKHTYAKQRFPEHSYSRCWFMDHRNREPAWTHTEIRESGSPRSTLQKRPSAELLVELHPRGYGGEYVHGEDRGRGLLVSSS